ncbi:hypothetical protein [Devosia aurantiaca]|uniref:Uncharacterized protein n=1 Tax=Devosia aurantiaca TaxID=2714858 RepID=A0A6M1SKL3_9HYPH|nr:hypothetical protein [Devosia aurantiaca]NGP17026.1 hypothetical protein [Devosia aurantiaca]
MRGGLLFLGMAILLFGYAVHGLLSDEVFALKRYSRELILRSEKPLWFGVTILAFFGLGAFMAGISAFLFWSRRKEKEAEERFFRKRKYLQ